MGWLQRSIGSYSAQKLDPADFTDPTQLIAPPPSLVLNPVAVELSPNDHSTSAVVAEVRAFSAGCRPEQRDFSGFVNGFLRRDLILGSRQTKHHLLDRCCLPQRFIGRRMHSSSLLFLEQEALKIEAADDLFENVWRDVVAKRNQLSIKARRILPTGPAGSMCM